MKTIEEYRKMSTKELNNELEKIATIHLSSEIAKKEFNTVIMVIKEKELNNKKITVKDLAKDLEIKVFITLDGFVLNYEELTNIKIRNYQNIEVIAEYGLVVIINTVKYLSQKHLIIKKNK